MLSGIDAKKDVKIEVEVVQDSNGASLDIPNINYKKDIEYVIKISHEVAQTDRSTQSKQTHNKIQPRRRSNERE